jgi:hypothetical protein
MLNFGSAQISQKSSSYLKILGARTETRSKLHTDDLQILGITVKKFSLPGELVTKILCSPTKFYTKWHTGCCVQR